ncbi:MAG: DUF6144 family protein [Spirochaetes bacterium]|nr:DUF6144 family protein [Spirochaetota bacterium]
MKETMNNWVNTILNEISQSKEIQYQRLLDQTGASCSQNHGFIDKALEIRKIVDNLDDINLLIQSFKESTSTIFDINYQDDTLMITYKMNYCPCPIVKNSASSNPVLCNCTKGFIKAIFSTLLSRDIKVELLESLLSGGQMCKLKLTLL